MAERKKHTVAETAEIILRDQAPAGQRPHLEPHARAVADATEKVLDQMRHAFGQMQEKIKSQQEAINCLKSPEHKSGSVMEGSDYG